MRIAFFDSGIGGLTVLHQAIKQMPQEDYLYYADTDHVPYGRKTKEEIRQYVQEAVDALSVLPKSYERELLEKLAHFTAKRDK